MELKVWKKGTSDPPKLCCYSEPISEGGTGIEPKLFSHNNLVSEPKVAQVNKLISHLKVDHIPVSNLKVDRVLNLEFHYHIAITV